MRLNLTLLLVLSILGGIWSSDLIAGEPEGLVLRSFPFEQDVNSNGT